MAIKGNGYAKTTWAFQERPVASAKLNTWDDRIEAAVELTHFLLSQAWGGGDGVVRGAALNDLNVIATSPVGLSVLVDPGYAFISNFAYRLAVQTESANVTIPVTNPRIDLVQARLDTWDLSIVEGTEAASPVAPSPDADTVVLAELFLRPGMSSIKDTDDATNGYITDARPFV